MTRCTHRLAAATALAIATAACGGSRSPAPSSETPPPTPPASGTTISGRERLGWNQAADSIAGYVFALYVDQARNELSSFACVPAAAGTFDCDAPLPPLTNGVHTLQLSAAAMDASGLVEGPRSAPLTVTVDGSASTAAAIHAIASDVRPPIPAAGAPAADGAPHPADVSCGVAPWNGSRLVAWTSEGELALGDYSLRTTRPLVWPRDAGTAWRLESLAQDPAAASFVYGVFTSASGAPALRVTRYREVDGVLGERAVLVESALPERPAKAGALFAPDALLSVYFTWAAPHAEPEPFVKTIDVHGLRPERDTGLDPRFTSRAVSAAAWGTEGRLWLLEPAGNGDYQVRAADAAEAAFRFTASEPPIGLQWIAGLPAPRLAVLAPSGPGWLWSEDSGLRTQLAPQRFDFGLPAATPWQSAVLAPGMAAGCHSGPRLTIAYSVWVSKPVPNAALREN